MQISKDEFEFGPKEVLILNVDSWTNISLVGSSTMGLGVADFQKVSYITLPLK